MKWKMVDNPPTEELPVFGDWKTAQVTIVNRGTPDDIEVECNCAACFEISEGGIPDDVLAQPGIHHMEAWHERIQLPESVEYDGGLRYASLCDCETCNPYQQRMIVCTNCGNKRCPKATDHRLACTNSNEPGQKGSSWENVPA